MQAALMSPSHVKVDFAATLLAAVVRTDGSRHVMASTAVALFRAIKDQLFDEQLGIRPAGPHNGTADAEVATRLRAVQLVLHEQVIAALDERPPAVSGDARVRRNIAMHSSFGAGAAVLKATNRTNLFESKRCFVFVHEAKKM